MNLNDLLEIIEQDLQSIQYPNEPKELYAPIQYTLEQKGKRIRPLLISMVYLLYKEDVYKVLPICRAIEVFHNFTLLHDDIMDKAPLRRGKETVYQKWNENIAILSGDVMLVQAYQHLQKIDSNKLSQLLDVFNKGAIKVCEGQQFDMQFETSENVSTDQYINMIYLKTAALLDHSVEMAAIYADASEKDIKHLKEFAKNIGIAFQLKDDLLDVYGDASKFGKQVGGDILADKKTYLLLKAKELSNQSQSETLNFWIGNNDNPTQKVQEITAIFNALEISKITNILISEYYEKGMNNLNSISSKNKEILADFIQNLMNREH